MANKPTILGFLGKEISLNLWNLQKLENPETCSERYLRITDNLLAVASKFPQDLPSAQIVADATIFRSVLLGHPRLLTGTPPPSFDPPLEPTKIKETGDMLRFL